MDILHTENLKKISDGDSLRFMDASLYTVNGKHGCGNYQL